MGVVNGHIDTRKVDFLLELARDQFYFAQDFLAYVEESDFNYANRRLERDVAKQILRRANSDDSDKNNYFYMKMASDDNAKMIFIEKVKQTAAELAWQQRNTIKRLFTSQKKFLRNWDAQRLCMSATNDEFVAERLEQLSISEQSKKSVRFSDEIE